MRLLGSFAVVFLAAPIALAGQNRPPILDMHLHAMGANDQGPAPVPLCAPFPLFPAWDQRVPYPAAFMGNLPCDEPIVSPVTDEAVRDETIAVMNRLNVFGVLSGSTERVGEWQGAAPDRFIPGLGFRVDVDPPSLDSLRTLFETGAVRVLAEITNQYSGISPADERMEPYWALAEELDIPVGIHMGPGPPGANYLGFSRYRASMSSALLLEDVLVRHPQLRVYVMHAGYPFIDDLLALLYAHPQVYAELGVVIYTRPREDFYRYLGAIVDAGFGNRVMFGSDQMVWPEAIARSVEAIQEAPFLAEDQKRGILYNNAARFLRLSEEEQARHWRR